MKKKEEVLIMKHVPLFRSDGSRGGKTHYATRQKGAFPVTHHASTWGEVFVGVLLPPSNPHKKGRSLSPTARVPGVVSSSVCPLPSHRTVCVDKLGV